MRNLKLGHVRNLALVHRNKMGKSSPSSPAPAGVLSPHGTWEGPPGAILGLTWCPCLCSIPYCLPVDLGLLPGCPRMITSGDSSWAVFSSNIRKDGGPQTMQWEPLLAFNWPYLAYLTESFEEQEPESMWVESVQACLTLCLWYF